MEKNTIPLWLFGLFILAILAGTYFRFTDPLDRIPTDDEIVVMVSAAKLNTNHPSYDARLYNFEHPFLGKKILGIWMGLQSPPLTQTAVIPVNLFTYNYLAAEELREWESSMRILSAIFSLLVFIPVFLIGRKWLGNHAALVGVVLISLSIGHINLSRYLIQDGLLSFFYLMTIYFFMCYVENSTEKWKGIEKKNIYLAATLGGWIISLLIRIHQPILLGASFIIILLWLKQPIKKILIGMILGMGIAVIAYSPTAVLEMATIKGSNAASENTGLHVLNVTMGMISQNSLTMVVLVILTITALVSRHQEWHNKLIHLFKRQPTNPIPIVAIWLTVIPLAASFVTSMGTSPRYFLVALALPLIYLGKSAVEAMSNRQKYLIGGAIVVDIILLTTIAPPFVGYTILGLPPVFLNDETPNNMRVFPLIDSLRVERFFTNDAGLILRNTRAAPLPPNYKRFAYYDLCDENFSKIFHKSIIVYRSPEPFYKNSFVCPFVKSAARPIPNNTIPALPPYEFYMVIDANQLSLSNT